MKVVEASRSEWSSEVRVSLEGRISDRHPLRVGTDCSGADAPVWALRMMGVQHQHVFSCDSDPHVRTFIQSASPPVAAVFADMLTRKAQGQGFEVSLWFTRQPICEVMCCGDGRGTDFASGAVSRHSDATSWS